MRNSSLKTCKPTPRTIGDAVVRTTATPPEINRRKPPTVFDCGVHNFIGSACEFNAEKCALSARVASFWSDIALLLFVL